MEVKLCAFGTTYAIANTIKYWFGIIKKHAFLNSAVPLYIPCLHHISEFNVAFDPLHFVLMFPRGEAGWGLGIKKGVLRNLPNAMPVVDQATHKYSGVVLMVLSNPQKNFCVGLFVCDHFMTIII